MKKQLMQIITGFILALPIVFSITGEAFVTGDVYIRENNIFNGGENADLQTCWIGGDDERFSYFEILNNDGINDIPAGSTIEEFKLSVLYFSAGTATVQGVGVNTTLFETNWNETLIDYYTTNPCVQQNAAGGDFGNPENCTSTLYSSQSVSGAGEVNFTFTDAAQKQLDRGQNNFSFMLYASDGDCLELRAIETAGTASDPHIHYTYTPPGTATPTFTITAIDAYDGSALSNITTYIYNSSFSFNTSTVNGTNYVTDAEVGAFNETYNILFMVNDSGGYYNISLTDVNISNGGSYEATLYQAILYVNVSEVITDTKLNNFWAGSPLHYNKSNSTGWAKLLLKAGTYNISANATGYITGWDVTTITAKTENYTKVTLGTGNLSINATSFISGNQIADFTINLTHLAESYSENRSTVNGTIVYPIIAGTYNLSITASGYASDSQLVTITASTIKTNVTFILYSENSMNVTIYDEETEQIINTTTTTLVFDHNISKETHSTSNGTFYIDDLFEGLYDIAASTPYHTQRHYFITIAAASYNTLDIWLLNTSSGTTITFNIKNELDQPLEDVFITVTNKINTSYVTVDQRYSDFAGQAQFFLESTTSYRFMLEAENYTTRVFDLEPASTTYNIIMQSAETIPFTTIYDKVNYAIFPNTSIVRTADAINFSMIVSSEGGHVSYFGLNSTLWGTKYITNVTGSAGGGTASIVLNTSNVTGSIPVDHFIQLSDEDVIVIYKSYYTSNITAGNYSLTSFAVRYEDEFSTIIKAVIAVFAAVAIIATFAELGVPAAISGVVGVLILMIFAILGWISILISAIISIIIMGMFLLKRGE